MKVRVRGVALALAAGVLVTHLPFDSWFAHGAQPSSGAPPGAPPGLDPAQLAAATRGKLDSEARAGRFSGAVLIARAGQPVLVEAYGLADREAGKPNTPDTQFRIGSAGKLFTVVAILQLAQAGKLDLEAPVGRYLPGYPNAEIATKATISNLLSHTGGTGDIFGPQFLAHQDELRSPADYLDLYGQRPPLFPPGGQRDYSNYGFMILGRIVEVVSGLPYDQYVQQNIFAVAGMTSSGFQPEADRLPQRAEGYLAIDGALERVTPQSLARFRDLHGSGYREYRGGPAGGGYATVGDLLRFANALTSLKLLNADYFRRLTTDRVTLTDGSQAGYDYGGRLPDGRRFIGHGGGAPGQSAEFRIYPASDYIIVVLANRDPPIATEIMDYITARLP